jgi:oligopeptidase B
VISEPRNTVTTTAVETSGPLFLPRVPFNGGCSSMQPRLFVAVLFTVLVAGVSCSTRHVDKPPRGIRVTMNHSDTTTSHDSTSRARLHPPVASKRPVPLEMHGQTRTDDYYWLRERENPEVISYLQDENAYLEAMTAHTAGMRQTLFDEIVERIPQTDVEVPVRLDDFFYYRRYEEGLEYPIYARRKYSLDTQEEVLLDVNELAEGHDYYSVAGVNVSIEHDILAFASDSVSRGIYTLRFKDLKTGRILPERIEGVTANSAWAKDNRTIFYTKQHPETLRWYQVYRHVLGTDPSQDELVYEEDDDTFNSYVYRTKSKDYIVIGSSQTMTDEYRIVDASRPMDSFEVFVPRERGHEHSINHAGNSFYIRTNDGARNFRLMKTADTATSRENWVEVIPHRENVYLGSFEVFRSTLVVSERENALTNLRIIPFEGDDDHYIRFEEPAYLVWIGENPEYDTETLRFNYTSMTTPQSVYDYDMATGERTLMKRDEVGGGFDPDDYATERVWATARDGRKVPVSIVYNRHEYRRDGGHPLLLYAYGSYGLSSEPTFNSMRLSLLDRGFAWAIAHIRGGQELGREWYEEGKLFHKKNSFTDFIDVAEFLIENDYADPDRIFAYGGSAGGLLMGAVVNMRPDLWRGVVAAVPFVDVVTTMLDADIPLTTSEYDEWGNPNRKEDYDYILSYSPYDQVEAKAYPNMLVTTGLHDPQVQYWEPAKWVAKLRAMKTDDNLLLLETDMDSGHGGTTGRFKRHHRTAMVYAFLLDLAGE